MFFAGKNLYAVRAANRFGAVVSKLQAVLDRRDEYGGSHRDFERLCCGHKCHFRHRSRRHAFDALDRFIDHPIRGLVGTDDSYFLLAPQPVVFEIVHFFDFVDVGIESTGDLDHPSRHPLGPAEDNDRVYLLGELLDFRKPLQRIDARGVSNLNVGKTLEDASDDLLVGFHPEGRLHDHPDRLETSETNVIDVLFALDDKDLFPFFARNPLKPRNTVMRSTAQRAEVTSRTQQFYFRLFLLRYETTSGVRQQGESFFSRLFSNLGRCPAHTINELFARRVDRFHIVGGANPLFSQTLFFESDEIKI